MIYGKNGTSFDIQNKGLLFRKRLNPVQRELRLVDFTSKQPEGRLNRRINIEMILE